MTTTEAKTVWECVWSNGNPYWMDRNVWTPTDAAPFTAGTSWYDLPQPFWAHDPDGEPRGPGEGIPRTDQAGIHPLRRRPV